MIKTTISIQAPYAQLIVNGLKPIEYRSWKTDYRGELLIHCSKGSDALKLYDLNDLDLPVYNDFFNNRNNTGKDIETDYFYFENGEIFYKKEHYQKHKKEYDFITYIYECLSRQYNLFESHQIIGSVDLVDIKKTDSGYEWILKNPVAFSEPIRYIKGKLRLWQYDL